MKKDIVDRLRDLGFDHEGNIHLSECLEAADEIERLRTIIERNHWVQAPIKHMTPDAK